MNSFNDSKLISSPMLLMSKVCKNSNYMVDNYNASQ